MPTLPRPEVDVLEGLTTAIIVDQQRMGAEACSTVGTATDANAILRILFSRLGQPHIGSPNAVSFNVPSVRASGAITIERGAGKTVRQTFTRTGGWCPRCEGRSSVTDFDLSQLYDDSKSLNEGALRIPGYRSTADTAAFSAAPATSTRVRRHPAERGGSVVEDQGDQHRRRVRSLVHGSIPAGAGVVSIDDGAIRGSRRGNPATYTGLLDPIRKAFAKANGVKPALFSANSEGACPNCNGATTLSGGERRRLKLATHMAEKGGVYVLDEPTTGLHLADVEQLLGLLDRLVDSGKSVIVIERHQAVMGHADWIIDLGPGAGHDGGRIVFEGTPADLVAARSTLTGEHLAAYVGA